MMTASCIVRIGDARRMEDCALLDRVGDEPVEEDEGDLAVGLDLFDVALEHHGAALVEEMLDLGDCELALLDVGRRVPADVAYARGDGELDDEVDRRRGSACGSDASTGAAPVRATAWGSSGARAWRANGR